MRLLSENERMKQAPTIIITNTNCFIEKLGCFFSGANFSLNESKYRNLCQLRLYTNEKRKTILQVITILKPF
jgi:hypothetical protein